MDDVKDLGRKGERIKGVCVGSVWSNDKKGVMKGNHQNKEKRPWEREGGKETGLRRREGRKEGKGIQRKSNISRPDEQINVSFINVSSINK